MTRDQRAVEAEFRDQFAEWLRFAVPLAAAEIATDPPTDTERKAWSETVLTVRHLPPNWRELAGFGDALMYPAKSHSGRVRAARVAETYARGLALLAQRPGGVTLFGAHFCAAPHDGCPKDWTPRKPLDVAATMAEFHRILDDYEALLGVDDPLAGAA